MVRRATPGCTERGSTSPGPTACMRASWLPESPWAPLAIPIPVFRFGFWSGARIEGMETFGDKTPGDPTDPIETLRGGDRRALAALLDHYRDRLRRMVELRLDPRLRGPLDASDVVQEAFLDVAGNLDA